MIKLNSFIYIRVETAPPRLIFHDSSVYVILKDPPWILFWLAALSVIDASLLHGDFPHNVSYETGRTTST